MYGDNCRTWRDSSTRVMPSSVNRCVILFKYYFVKSKTVFYERGMDNSLNCPAPHCVKAAIIRFNIMIGKACEIVVDIHLSESYVGKLINLIIYRLI